MCGWNDPVRFVGEENVKKVKKVNENTGFEQIGVKNVKKVNENTGFQHLPLENSVLTGLKIPQFCHPRQQRS